MLGLLFVCLRVWMAASDGFDFTVYANLGCFTGGVRDLAVSHFSILPCKIDGVAAAGSQTFDRAFGPRFGQGGKKMNESAMGLDQHFGHPGRCAHIGFDLKKGAFFSKNAVEAIGEGLGAQHFPEVMKGGVAIAQAGVDIHSPSAGPADADGTMFCAVCDAFLRSFHKGGRLFVSDANTRVEGIQMTEVPVTGFGFLVGFVPFENAAIRADVESGVEFWKRLLDLTGERVVDSEFAGGSEGISQQFGDDLLAHGGFGAYGRKLSIRQEEAVFRGTFRRGDEFAILLGEPIKVEASMSFQERVAGFFEELLVSGVSVVGPDVLTHPAAAVNPAAPLGAGRFHGGRGAKFAGVVAHPASHSILLLGRDRSASGQCLHPGEDRLVRLAEVGGLGGPVVHLHVDVEVVVVIPRSLDMRIPETL